MTFVLYRGSENRVILGAELPKGGVLIREIEAPHWGAARETIHELEFEHRPGYGWF